MDRHARRAVDHVLPQNAALLLGERPIRGGRVQQRPPTREQLMAGSANLRRVYKVEA